MTSEDSQNLAATDAAQAQKKQEPMGDLPDWVPGDLPDDKKKEFVEAVKKAWESDNTQFDFNGRVYKITEKELVGNQKKLDVNGNGKIDGDDLAKLRGEKQMDEHHYENETETPGQDQYPGSGIEDTNGNGEIDGEDKAKMPEEDDNDEGLDEGTRTKKAADMQLVTHGAMSMADYRAKWKNIKAKAPVAKKPAVKESTELDEAKDYHAAALSASEHAKNQPSATTHKAASDAHEKAVSWHERKITGLIKKDGSADEVKKHEEHIKMHKNEAQKHRFNAHRLEKKAVKEGAENPTDKLTIDVPAMIRSLEKAREDFKSDEDVHNFVQDLLKKKDATIDTNALPTNEALDPKADAGVWISDFVNSTDPKFDGKSKEERKQQALAAWYAARREAGIKEETVNEGAPADAKGGPEVMDVATKKMKDEADKNVKVEDAPYTNKADGSEDVTPADKPKANPSPMPTLTKEQAIRSVADAYAAMLKSEQK